MKRIILIILFLPLTALAAFQLNNSTLHQQINSPPTIDTQSSQPEQNEILQNEQLGELANPLYSDGFITHWAQKAAAIPYNFDYKEYQKQIAYASSYFTENGWQDFQTTLARFGDEKTIEKYKVRVSGRVRGRVVILNKGVLNGIYTWKVTLQMGVVYSDSFKTRRSSLLVTLMLQRAPTEHTHDGLVITSYLTTIRSVVQNKQNIHLANNSH